MANKTLSGLIALAFLWTTCSSDDLPSTLRLASFLVLPLACIWFSEAMGNYTGPASAQAITRTSPGCVIAALGWLLLLLPIILSLLLYT